MRLLLALPLIVALTGCRPEPPQSSLLDAAKIGSVSQVEKRLDGGTRIDETDSAGATALHYASLRGHMPVVELLLKRGANVAARDTARRSPLHYAASFARAEVMRRLIDAGADVGLADDHGLAAAHLCAVAEAPAAQVIDALSALRDAQANLLARDNERRAPVYFAATTGQVAVVEFLVDSGATLRGNDTYGMTLLHAAARGAGLRRDISRRPMLNYLLEHELAVDATDVEGRTALHFAAQAGASELVEMLVARGANLNALDIERMGVLHYALSDPATPTEARLRTMAVLIGLGATVDAPNGHGDTPLHLAADTGALAVARLLISRGADVNARTRDGMTPLHAAARRGATDVIDLLLSHGADPGAKTAVGTTPRGLAERNGQSAAAKMLEAGGRRGTD